MAKTNSTPNPGNSGDAAWMTGRFAVVWASAGLALARALSADCGGGARVIRRRAGRRLPPPRAPAPSATPRPARTGGGIPVQVTCGAGNGASCVATCSGGITTTYTGTVYDPAGANPLYNVAVYIPNSPLPDPLPAGARCGCWASSRNDSDERVDRRQRSLRSRRRAHRQGDSLVVQAGKWRKIYHVDIDSPCQSNAATDGSLRLPRSASEGNLPDIAISTGGADSLECLPLRIGVDASEFRAAGAGHSGPANLDGLRRRDHVRRIGCGLVRDALGFDRGPDEERRRLASHARARRPPT